MATIRQFEDVVAWQKARELNREIYRVSSQGAFGKDFGLRNQIRRASVSITSNIAEGFERGGSKEFLQFLSHAKGSCGEVRSQLHLSKDLGYLSEDDWLPLHDSCLEISRLIDGFSTYLRGTAIRGSKFKPAPASEPT